MFLKKICETKFAVTSKNEDLTEDMKREYFNLKSESENMIKQSNEDLKTDIYRTLSQLIVNYQPAKKKVLEDPDLKAKDIIGIIKPLEKFMEYMNLEKIGEIDQKTYFDEKIHAPVEKDAKYSNGDEVTIKFVGYKMNGKILDKAKVK
jgi:molecular chaperone GrpE (heat shock protein)